MDVKYQKIHDAHHALVEAVSASANPGYEPIPISLVSATADAQGQMIVFDGAKFKPSEVAKRLRVAADFLDRQSSDPAD